MQKKRENWSRRNNVKYIDHHGNEQEISEEVEKQFAKENKNWVPVQWGIVVILIVAVIGFGYKIYEGLPK